MARSRRNRASSVGSTGELSRNTTNAAETTKPVSNSASILLSSLLHWRDCESGKMQVHVASKSLDNFAVTALLLARLRSLPSSENLLHKQWLTVRDEESGYTPLHSAVYDGDLKTILLFLRHAAANHHHHELPVDDPLLPPRCTFRVIEALMDPTFSHTTKFNNTLLTSVLAAKDNESMTPGQLLAAKQVTELRACRLQCVYRPKFKFIEGEQRRQRRSSFDDVMEDEQNEFDLLSRHVQRLQRRQEQQQHTAGDMSENDSHHSCEVFTFGRAHPCALGVGQDTPEQVRPQRVQAFAQSHITDGAVNVAAAAHHTLVVTAAGHLYAFGLGKGGRLGLGNEGNVPLPARVLGALSHKHVVAVAAAENHSLCVTRDGLVFSWGSNRFGQLGNASALSMSGNTTSAAADASRCLPRRVDDLKNVHCVAVAAGMKHSVALSSQGEVYVWGDNTAGQLALNRRSGAHKVQRVEALWNPTGRKKVVSVAAADQATLVLALPSGSGIPVNSVYSWGHGSHVPTKVHFDASLRVNHRNHPVNPVAIACAKFHNVAMSADGLVYTWGLHAEPLGTATRCASTQPQLVTGMLPENGGGIAVAVSASENHTAVLTDTGALYTWGATTGTDVLGHAGVRWQEEPKRVEGVCRAVSVSAAREHTVLLVGTSFPPLPKHDESSLEKMVVRTVAENIDLFNVLPSLVVAERTASMRLIDYCFDFISRNIDSVMNVAQRSVLDCFLDEQLMTCLLSERGERDAIFHPLLDDIVKVGTGGTTLISELADWFDDCDHLLQTNGVKIFVEKYGSIPSAERTVVVGLQRLRSNSESSTLVTNAYVGQKSRNSQGCSDRCIELTTNMDLSTKELLEAKKICIAKEIRGVRKRLSQIIKLEEHEPANLTVDQLDKLSRRQQLDADLHLFEPALDLVEKKLKDLLLTEKDDAVAKNPLDPDHETTEKECEQAVSLVQKFFCELCKVKCPDVGSYASHMSGRKHRNKVTQTEEDDRKQAATLILENQVLNDSVEARSSFVGVGNTVTRKQASWKQPAHCPLPVYRLPGPPHVVPNSVIPPKLSLTEIIKEESMGMASNRGKQPVALRKPIASHKAPILSLSSSSVTRSASPAAFKTALSVTTGTAGSSPVHSLGDFLSRSVPSPKATPNSPVAWTPSNPVSKSPQKTLLDIQRHQEQLKKNQPRCSLSANTKWYVGQQERAASLQELQLQDEKDKAERLLIEEQFRIEMQIFEELRAAKTLEKRKRKPKSSRKCTENGAGEPSRKGTQCKDMMLSRDAFPDAGSASMPNRSDDSAPYKGTKTKPKLAEKKRG